MSLAFVRQALAHPKDIGSVWPSSPALARQMLAEAALQPGDRVVELGAGTGPFTRLLDAHDGPVLALEPVAELAVIARQAAPRVEVVEALAHQLPDLLAERDWPHADAILSGLPFAVWEPERQDAVLDAVLATLKPGGRFVTFTYAHSRVLPAARRLAKTLRERFGPLQVSPVVWACVPPCVVYRLER